MAAVKMKMESDFAQARDALDDIEARMGELAAYLSDIADALSHDPASLRLRAADWPDLLSLSKLQAMWVERRDALLAAWRNLGPRQQAANPLPPFDAADPSLPRL